MSELNNITYGSFWDLIKHIYRKKRNIRILGFIVDAFSQELLTYLAPRPCRSCGSRCREACTWWRCAVSEAEVGCAGSTCAWWRSPGRWCLPARDNRVTPSKCCRGVALRSLPSTLRDPPLNNNNNTFYVARTVNPCCPVRMHYRNTERHFTCGSCT